MAPYGVSNHSETAHLICVTGCAERDVGMASASVGMVMGALDVRCRLAYEVVKLASNKDSYRQ